LKKNRLGSLDVIWRDCGGFTRAAPPKRFTLQHCRPIGAAYWRFACVTQRTI